MACTVNLFNQLGGVPDQNGTWTLISAGSVTLNVNGGGDASYNNGQQIGTDYNTTIDVSGTSSGTFTIRYSTGVNPCDDNANLIFTINDGAIAGTDAAYTYCAGDNVAKNIYSLLGGTPDNDGVWSDTSGSFSAVTYTGYDDNSTSNDPTDDTFTPSTAGAGVYEFYYQVDHGDRNTPAGCDNCEDESNLTITVIVQGNAGTGTPLTLCNSQ